MKESQFYLDNDEEQLVLLIMSVFSILPCVFALITRIRAAVN